jgi:hypothetical protein
VIDAAGTPYVVSVAPGDTDAVADLTLDASNATVEVAGTLAAAGTVAVTGGTLDVPGVLRAGSIIDGALLTFHGNFTLDDTPLALGGTLQVSSSSGATFTLGTGEVVTQNGLDALIANGGTIGNTLVNQGSIDAGVAGGTMTIAVPHVVNQGTIAVSNGDTLDVSSAVDSGSGTIEVGGSGIADFATSVDAGQTLDFADASGILKLRAPASFAASIANFVPGDTIDLPGIAADSATWSTGQLTIGNAGTSVAMLSLPGDYSSDAFTVASDGGGGSQVTVTATCYAAGTRIATPRGEVPIERLHRDDLVQTISGRPQRISWIGHRRVDFRRHPNRRRILPVRIAANAFGPGRPKRNLLLSPDHAVFVEGVLIPIRHLINGANVVQLERHSITYYHIELPRHDVLIAEGMPAESYLEAGARGAFGNGDMVIQLHPDFTPPQDHYAMLWEQYGYAPLVMAGEAVERVRDLLSRNRYAA